MTTEGQEGKAESQISFSSERTVGSKKSLAGNSSWNSYKVWVLVSRTFYAHLFLSLEQEPTKQVKNARKIYLLSGHQIKHKQV